ncbi:MAG: hemolysin III family protein [Dehalococcoidia bacterium]
MSAAGTSGFARRIDAAQPRPMLRGVLHLLMALAAPAALVALLLWADSARDYVGVSIYGTSVLLLYSVSAGYHLVPWPARIKDGLGRADHSMIFVLIAGTYTPFCLKVIGDAWGISILSVVWALAGAGVVLKVVWPQAPRWLSVGLYLAVGWVAVVSAKPVVEEMSAWALALLLLGGAMYSIGALVYGARRPDPYPRVFGYHEVFHLLVVGGTLAHFMVIAGYVLDA